MKVVQFKVYFLVFIIIALLCGIAVLGFQYRNARARLFTAQNLLASKTTQTKTLDFTKLFIADVLDAKGEIDFETRLKLETAVRDLNDEEVLAAWNAFTGSQNEQEAQERVKQLLQLLVDKSRAT